MGTLVLIRHGQSQWNLENRFTGWTDVPLTDQGRADAAAAARTLGEFRFDRAFTSALARAADTLAIILTTLGQESIPVVADAAFNERHYGELQGLNKTETAAKYGQEQVKLWRRSYSTRPPGGESIEDCEARVMPFFTEHILPHLRAGETILVAAHGNSMRPIIKHLDGLDPETAATMEIGLCTPYIYRFDATGRMTQREVRSVPGIVTKGASTTEARVESGRV